jgi:hypothetical protein
MVEEATCPKCGNKSIKTFCCWVPWENPDGSIEQTEGVCAFCTRLDCDYEEVEC